MSGLHAALNNLPVVSSGPSSMNGSGSQSNTSLLTTSSSVSSLQPLPLSHNPSGRSGAFISGRRHPSTIASPVINASTASGASGSTSFDVPLLDVAG
jgi:hypothetical protein